MSPAPFTELELSYGYEGSAALTQFYVPVLTRAVRYDRTAGYFRASSLAAAAQGIARFIANGGTMNLVCGVELKTSDCEALLGNAALPQPVADRLLAGLATSDDVAGHRLGVLAWLVRAKRLNIRLAVRTNEEGDAVGAEEADGYFHEKLGVFYDAHSHVVTMIGSNNESKTAWIDNFESFSVTCSWTDPGRTAFEADRFRRRWEGEIERFTLVDLPTAVEHGFVALAPDDPPSKDLAEPPEDAPPETVARFLSAAPHLPNGEALAEATTGVRLFPHQRKVVDRLAGQYPRSWLVADEVGLGKTISAGMALRRLLLSGQAARVAVLAPANVCIQWQDELFEKFGLWVPRLDAGKMHGAHHDDIRPLEPNENPYATEPILLVSSHLARRRDQQKLFLEAPRYDLLIVDEAHHARRQAADHDEYRPSRLMELLDRVVAADRTEALWLLTATPMQVDPIELFDLLRVVGLPADARDFASFERFYRHLAAPAADTDWTVLARGLADLPAARDAADEAQLQRIAAKVGMVAADRIAMFGLDGSEPADVAKALTSQQREELRAWIRQRSPVGRFVTRHSRETLKRYRDQGLLTEPIADRKVKAVPIDFTPDERLLYLELDDLIDRLMLAHGTRKGAGFVLTTYRRRLTSSWAAIEASFRRRVEKDASSIALGADTDLLDEAEDAAEEQGDDHIDEDAAVPLTEDERQQMRDFLDRLAAMRYADSKFDQLVDDINDARSSGEALIVFTQFTTTMNYLRDRLHGMFRSELATYSGNGGLRWHDDGGWQPSTKAELVDALRSRQVSVIVATDAASEGLNMQAASWVVNFDLPWNPMRVEQRIGRIDRIGQPQPTIQVRNYTIPGTVEESVYRALAERIDSFSDLVGRLQPILGATEQTFKRIYRQPRSERDAERQNAIQDLTDRIDELEDTGIDFIDEDPMPDPTMPPPATDLAGLTFSLDAHLGVTLGSESAPVTHDPRYASRDRENWKALATYGHPDLAPALAAAAAAGPEDALVIVERSGCAAAVRADRVPPEPVLTLSDLNDLGDPVSAGDAVNAAKALVETQLARRQRRRSEVAQQRTQKTIEEIARRFCRAVRRGLQAEVSLRAASGAETATALGAWLELTASDEKGWRRANRFRQLLRLAEEDIIPADVVPDGRPPGLLRAEVRDVGSEISALIGRWRAVTGR